MAKSAPRRAHDEARVRAAEWYAVIDEDADLDYLLNTALPQAKEVTEDAKRSPDDRLMAAMTLELIAAGITKRVAYEL